jgi:phospholipid/cholesterol/gamma-HCH transport system substrate-binding protein
METRPHYVAVGAFILLIMAAGFGAVVWLGRIEFRQELRPYYIFFRGSVAGLSRGSAVQYNGIPVGRVSDIRVDTDNVEQIQVTVEIDGNLVDIKTNARAYLDTNILSGVSTIQIRGGTQEAAILEPQPDHRYPVIRAGQSELEAVKASLPELLGELKQASRSVNAVLDQTNRDAIADSLRNIRTVTGALAADSQHLGPLLDNANNAAVALKSLIENIDQSYVQRGGLKDGLLQTLRDFDRAAVNVAASTHQLQLMLGENRPEIRSFVETTLPNVDDLVNATEALVGNLNQFVVQLQRDPTRLLFGDRRQGYRPR